MNILDSTDYLLEELAGLCFLQLLALDDVVEKLTAARIFHDKEELS